MSVQEDILAWQKTNNPKILGSILKEIDPLLNSQANKYAGELPFKLVKAHTKRFAIDSFKNYDPSKSAVSTHVVNNLKRMNRVNFESSSTVRMSEELRSGVNVYKQAKEYLTDKLNREPSLAEIADHLNWSLSRVARTEKNLVKEVLDSTMQLAPSFTESDDPRLDYIYHDLSPVDRKIFQHKIGYKGSRILPSKSIAQMVRLSPGAISMRSNKIADLIKNKIGVS